MVFLLGALSQRTKDNLFNKLFGYNADSDNYYIIYKDNKYSHGSKPHYDKMGYKDIPHGDVIFLLLEVLGRKAYLISNTNYYSMDKTMAERELNKIRNTYLVNLNFNVMTFDDVRKKMNEVEEKYYIIEVSL